MRVTYVLNRHPAISTTFVSEEVAALRDLGFEVQTISVRRSEKKDAVTESAVAEQATTSWLVPASALSLIRGHAMAMVRFPRPYLATAFRALSFAPPGAKALLWQLLYFGLAVEVWRRAESYGSQHLHTHFSFAGSDIALLAAEMGRRSGRGPRTFSITMHGPDEFSDVERTRIGRKAEFADAVIAISDFARSQIFRVLPPSSWTRVQIIHCGIDTEKFALTDLAADRQRRRIITVGRLVPAKGQAVLIDAFRQLLAEGCDAELELIGTGPDSEALRARARASGASERITFAGALGGTELRQRLAQADVFCLPSFAEGLPVVLMEAMAMGLPIVATRIMGVPELVIDGCTGRLVPPSNSRALADALRAALSEDGKSMRLRGRSLVESEFDIRRSARALAHVYSACSTRGG